MAKWTRIAASVAGLIKHIQAGKIEPDATIVCVLTGNGLKDPDIALRLSTVDLTPVPADLEKVKEVMGL